MKDESLIEQERLARERAAQGSTGSQQSTSDADDQGGAGSGSNALSKNSDDATTIHENRERTEGEIRADQGISSSAPKAPAPADKTGDGGRQPERERTEAEQKVDERVEEETRRQQKARAQQLEDEHKQKLEAFEASEKSLATRATVLRLGRVEHLGCRGVYIGRAPQSEDGKSNCPSCDQPLTGGNSKFEPLPSVTPEAGLLVKDPYTDQFYSLPSDGSLSGATAQTWLILNSPTGKPLVPELGEKGRDERLAAAGLSE